MIRCSHCGATRVHDSASSTCEICGERLPSHETPPLFSPPVTGIVWEHAEQQNLINAFIATIKECLVRPSYFFKHITETSSLFHALLFGLVAGSIGILFDILWLKTVVNAWEGQAMQGIETGLAGISMYSLIFSPAILLIHIYLLSLYVHVLLLVTRAHHAAFRSTVITICYTQSASVLSIIPGLGNIISPLWALIILIIGVSCVHRISKTRSCVTILLPFVAVGLFASFILIAALSGSFILGIFLKEIFPFIR